MASGRRSRVNVGVDEAAKLVTSGEISQVDAAVVECDVKESARVALRQRWELASVLNFLKVFEPILGTDVKMSAEEIEMGLIEPDVALRRLHVTLLKGIPPGSRKLNETDGWITVLCIKLKQWWRQVAEGDLPLSSSNGGEIEKYKKLDPTTRLLILKALCEVRSNEDDAISYINDQLKDGIEISYFRKDNIGGDGNGTTYWCDNDAANGYRLYKEVTKLDSKKKVKANSYLNNPNISFQWETIATNFQEFRKIVDEFTSSKSVFKVTIGRTLESDAMAELEKMEKRKERALKKQEKQAQLLSNYRNSSVIGTTRSCRNLKPASYTFDEYDKAIDEAIQVSKKTTDGGRLGGRSRDNGVGYDGSQSSGTDSQSKRNSGEEVFKAENNQDKIEGQHKASEADGTEEDYKDEDNFSDASNYDEEVDIQKRKTTKHLPEKKKEFPHKHFGSRWSTRLTKTNEHPSSSLISCGTKKTSSQKLAAPSASNSLVVLDSKDEGTSANANSSSGGQNQPASSTDTGQGSDP